MRGSPSGRMFPGARVAPGRCERILGKDSPRLFAQRRELPGAVERLLYSAGSPTCGYPRMCSREGTVGTVKGLVKNNSHVASSLFDKPTDGL